MIRTVASQLRRLAIAAILCVTLWTVLHPAAMAEVPPQVSRLQVQVNTLQGYVQNKEWLEVRSYIHGPMGQVRRQLFFISQDLPKAKRAAIEDDIADVSKNLNLMDEAAEVYSATSLVKAQKALDQAVENIAKAF